MSLVNVVNVILKETQVDVSTKWLLISKHIYMGCCMYQNYYQLRCNNGKRAPVTEFIAIAATYLAKINNIILSTCLVGVA